jgi:hypothetical protein
MNNLALFVTHYLFLTRDQIEEITKGNSLDVLGHNVPIWVDAKTGKATEPGKEFFCNYRINNIKSRSNDIIIKPRKGYEVFLPSVLKWVPPPELDMKEVSLLPENERKLILKDRDRWWFNNPKPFGVEDLKNGYIRFEVKKTKQKIQGKEYSAQHVIEIAEMSRLLDSLTI